jgi:hypothetical protein
MKKKLWIIILILAAGLTFTTYVLIKQHKELYGYKNGTGIGNCLITKEKAEEYMDFYKKNYSTDPNHTEGVWFSEDIIRCLYINLIREDKKDTVDGFRVYFSTYTKDNIPASAQASNPIANTVLFVPTTPKNEKHKDLWNLISKEKEKSRLLEGAVIDAPNHGALCPNQCN